LFGSASPSSRCKPNFMFASRLIVGNDPVFLLEDIPCHFPLLSPWPSSFFFLADRLRSFGPLKETIFFLSSICFCAFVVRHIVPIATESGSIPFKLPSLNISLGFQRLLNRLDCFFYRVRSLERLFSFRTPTAPCASFFSSAFSCLQSRRASAY